MCKLDDKYWQVGDEVYNRIRHRKGAIVKLNNTEDFHSVGVSYYNKKEKEVNDWYSSQGYYAESQAGTCLPEILHYGAITFDEHARPIAINYDYVPDRTPKVMVTKLPHEFVEGEEVLVSCNGIWCKRKFSHYTDKIFQSYVMKNQHGYKFCIPFIGNEHMETKAVLCESGRVPDKYVFPEKELFSDVKVGDILYRLDGGKYIRGRVSTVSNDSFYFRTETEVSFKDTLNCIWEYTYKGELQGEEHLGQVLFFEKPEHVFKPFDKVLVRHSKIATWEIDFFSSYGKNDGFRLRCLSGYYEYCLPFEGNEHLLGTTDNPEE